MTSAPAAEGFSLPPEWAHHERTLMAWPARRELWGSLFEQAEADYASCARAIAGFEPVVMVANPGEGRRAGDYCGAEVEVVELPVNDSWLRDNGPITLRRRDGARLAVDFGFNGWGRKYVPFEHDAALSRPLCEHLGLSRRSAAMVLEGGSIDVDGEGTLITTEQCLMNPNRNPSMDKGTIEQALCSWLGAQDVVWLRHGLIEDTDTDGHVDNVCRFAGPGRLLVQVAPPGNPNHDNLAANLRHLQGIRRAGGSAFEILPLELLPEVSLGGRVTSVRYLNFYFANHGVVVPLAGASQDAAALEWLAGVWPDREVVGAPGAALAFGGGGVHCITQQVPAATNGRP